MNKDAFVHYKVDIKNIDLDHLQVIELIEKITSASEKKEWELGVTYLTELQLLKNSHFLEEERMMEEVNFPYIRYHKLDHLKIIFELEEFMKQFRMYGLGFRSEKLVKLILDHIDHYDKQYMPYYASWLTSNNES